MISALRQGRGAPLYFLIAILAGWVLLRTALWEPILRDDAPLPLPRASGAGVEMGADGVSADRDGDSASPGGEESDEGESGSTPLPAPLPGLIPAPLDPSESMPAWNGPAWNGPVRDSPLAAFASPYSAPDSRWTGSMRPYAMSRANMAVGHAMLAMMGLSRMEVPPVMAAYLDMARQNGGGDWDSGNIAGFAEAGAPAGTPAAARAPAGAESARATVQPGVRRWSADAWLMVRDGESARALPAGQPSYGRSQAGAALRYRLAPSSGHRPLGYARVSSALESPRDAELAAGLSARPLAEMPVRLAAELRVSDTQNGTDLRPAAFAVTEFPPIDLPLGARGEVYLQGGYVGGDFATGFIDGQARIDRDVTRIADSRISAGVGAWGGAQKGASRVDIGPSASVSFRLGEVFSRVSLDYRFRVAGHAEPKSGPALTLAAGF